MLLYLAPFLRDKKQSKTLISTFIFALFSLILCRCWLSEAVRRLSLLHGWCFFVGVGVSVVVHRLSLVHGWPLLLFGIDVVLVLNVWILCPFPFFSLCLVLTLCFLQGIVCLRVFTISYFYCSFVHVRSCSYRSCSLANKSKEGDKKGRMKRGARDSCMRICVCSRVLARTDKYALRVPPAETRLTIYRRLRVIFEFISYENYEI